MNLKNTISKWIVEGEQFLTKRRYSVYTMEFKKHTKHSPLFLQKEIPANSKEEALRIWNECRKLLPPIWMVEPLVFTDKGWLVYSRLYITMQPIIKQEDKKQSDKEYLKEVRIQPDESEILYTVTETKRKAHQVQADLFRRGMKSRIQEINEAAHGPDHIVEYNTPNWGVFTLKKYMTGIET